MERTAEFLVGEAVDTVGGHDGIRASGASDDHAEFVAEGFGEQGRCAVGAHELFLALPVGVVDLDVQVDERVEVPVAIVRDGFDDAVRNVATAVGVGEGERRRLAEAVVLESGEGGGRSLGRRPVDDSGPESALVGAESKVDVGRRYHRIAGSHEGDIVRFGRVEDRFRVLLDGRPVKDLKRDVVVVLESLEVGTDEFAGVELGEDLVGRLERFLTFDGDGALVIESESDEREHMLDLAGVGIKGAKRQAYRRWPARTGMSVPCVRTDREAGEAIRQRLADADLVADGYDIVVEDEDIFIPVTDPAAVPADLDVVTRDAPVRETQTMPGDLIDFTASYERIGDVVVVDEDDPDRAAALAEALMASDLPVRTVLNRASKIKGETRVRDWEILAGDGTEAVHREYGSEFAIDLAEVYFSPRLATERHRVVEQVDEGERAFDMFAGVGPFVIPFARRGAECLGCDINDVAIEYLRENAERNGVTDRITAICGDVREVAEEYENWADRIVMNLPHSADEFLDTAVDVAGDDCVLHYYDIQHEDDRYGPGERAIREAAEPEYDITVETRHTVRSYAPHELNIVLDVRLTR